MAFNESIYLRDGGNGGGDVTIPITSEFAVTDGAHGFDLYDPQDIKAGNVNVVLQAIASGAFKGGSHATSPAGEVVAQVKTTTGAPTHSASEGTICWNSVDDALYVNNNGTTGWTLLGGGSGAPTGAKYIVQEAHADLSAEQSLGLLTTGILKNTVTAAVGVLSTAVGADLPSHVHAATDLTSGIIPDARMPDMTGDVTTVEGAVATTIAADAVTYAKIQNVSATDKVLGRSTAGAGDVEEIACTAAGRALIDDADATAQRATLAIGSILPPIFPFSCFPASPNAFANVHVGAGANSKQDQGLGVAASITVDTIWRLRFQLPGTLPPGTLKLRLIALANATANAVKINPKWASTAMEESPSGMTLNAETTQTITWAAGDNDQYKELKVTLDADTAVGGEIIVMDLTFETTGWTLAVVSTWIPTLVWE